LPAGQQQNSVSTDSPFPGISSATRLIACEFVYLSLSTAFTYLTSQSSKLQDCTTRYAKTFFNLL